MSEAEFMKIVRESAEALIRNANKNKATPPLTTDDLTKLAEEALSAIKLKDVDA